MMESLLPSLYDLEEKRPHLVAFILRCLRAISLSLFVLLVEVPKAHHVERNAPCGSWLCNML